MKKAYINPNSKLIQLSAEESMLISVSNESTGNETPGGFGGMGGDNTGGDYEGDLTNRHSAIWDTWK